MGARGAAFQSRSLCIFSFPVTAAVATRHPHLRPLCFALLAGTVCARKSRGAIRRTYFMSHVAAAVATRLIRLSLTAVTCMSKSDNPWSTPLPGQRAGPRRISHCPEMTVLPLWGTMPRNTPPSYAKREKVGRPGLQLVTLGDMGTLEARSITQGDAGETTSVRLDSVRRFVGRVH